MKNVFYAFGILILLSSCSKDDKLSDTIVGVWKLQTFSVTECTDSANNIATINGDENGCIIVDGVTLCTTFDFKSDGTMITMATEDGETETINYTYTTNDETNELTVCESFDCETVVITNGVFSFSEMIGSCTFNSSYSK